MKSLKKWLLIILSAMLAVSALAAFAACGGNKGKAEVTLTFFANGGTAVDAITAKPGDTVELPATEQEGYTFDGWFLDPDLGGEALPSSIPAPKKDTSYYAGWIKRPEAEYTVNIYLQTTSATAYRRDPKKTVSGTGYVGESFTPDPASLPGLEHFTYEPSPRLGANDPEPVISLTLSEDAAENVFTLYFNRNEYAVRYDANLPAGLVKGSVSEQKVRYEGTTVTKPNGFTASGYRFVGWSEKQHGVEDEDILLAGDTDDLLTVLGPTTLYAVWDRAYTDRYNGTDLIYFPRLEPGVAYMQRGGHEFCGEREGNGFTFKNADGEVMLEGVVSGLHFSYKHENIAQTYVLYDNYMDPKYTGATDPKRYNTDVTLAVDEYLNATYKDEKGEHKGVLAFDNTRGDYLLTFEDGTESFYVQFRETEEDDNKFIFMIAGVEANYYLEVLSLEYAGYLTGEALILDGYGNAVLYTQTASSTFLGFDGSYYIETYIYDEGTDTYIFKVYVDIVDPYGMLDSEPGEYASYVMTIPLDTSEPGEEFDGYVISNGLFLGYDENDQEIPYQAADGDGKLFLDGLGYFNDSAVYTDANGEKHAGKYDYIDDTYSGFIVTMTDAESKQTYTFKLNFGRDGYTFEVFDASQIGKYHEYLRMTDTLGYPALILLDTTVEEDGVQGKRAEIWITLDGGNTVFKGGEGWWETDDSRGIPIYTFHRLSAVEGYENEVPGTLKFYTTQVNRAEDNRAVDVYILLEEDSEVQYKEYELADGSTIWGNIDPSLVLGVGSLWFQAGGSVVEGSFAEGRSSYFDYSYIAFTYGDGLGNAVTDRYTEGDSGVWDPVEGAELELQVYVYTESSEEGAPGQAGFVMNLVLDKFLLSNGAELARSGNAVYDYGNADQAVWQDAAYEAIGSTVFGENIYSLKVGGEEVFKFVVVLFTDNYGTQQYVYFIENEELGGEFESAGGGSLTLDGYYWAEYIDPDGNRYTGTYSANPEGDELYFTPTDGTDFYISIDTGARTFYPLDHAFGSWIIVDYTGVAIGGSEDGAQYYVFDFNGRGNVTVRLVGGTGGNTTTGVYELVDADNSEYVVHVNIPVSGYGAKPEGWHIQLYTIYGENEAILYDEATAGTFINADWDVLWLDGFGGGTLYSADGDLAGSGVYSILNENYGFMMFMFNDETTVYLILDEAKGSFRTLDYSDKAGVWFASDLDYLAFGKDGIFDIGSSNDEDAGGAYFFDEEYIYMVLYTMETITIPIPKATDTTITVKGKTYYRWENEDGTLTLDGKVEFYDRGGEKLLETPATLEVTLKFEVRIGPNYHNAATFIVKEGQEHEGTYSGFILNLYTDGVLNPRVSYNDFTYFVTFNYDGTDKSTFTVKAGYTSVVMNDYYNGLQSGGEDGTGNYTGGAITKEILGFGPITFEETKYSGTFYYGNKTPSQKAEAITFKDVAEKDVRDLGFRSDLQSDLCEIVFESGDKKYAIDFVESYAEELGACYILWGFYTYEEKEFTYNSETYTAGLKYLIRATAPGTPGYGHDGYSLLPDDLVDQVVNVTLIKQDKTFVEPADLGITLSHDGVWMAVPKTGDTGGYDGYLLTFTKDAEGKITEVKLEIYTLVPAVAVGGFLVYYLANEEGKPVNVVMVAYTNESGLYTQVENINEFEAGEDGTWTFKGTVSGGLEQQYKVQIAKDEDGKYVVTVTQVKE